jgi:hypothetical protein
MLPFLTANLFTKAHRKLCVCWGGGGLLQVDTFIDERYSPRQMLLVTFVKLSYLEEPEHVKHGCVSRQSWAGPHAELAHSGGLRAAPELQHLLHQNQTSKVRRIIAPAYNQTPISPVRTSNIHQSVIGCYTRYTNVMSAAVSSTHIWPGNEALCLPVHDSGCASWRARSRHVRWARSRHVWWARPQQQKLAGGQLRLRHSAA